jgi:protein-S-isoprenylcysteine O-methyltransferase Ste14
LPEGANPMDMEWIKNNIDQIPIGAKIFVVIAHFVGIVVGMFIAAKIPKQSMVPSYSVGALMLTATLFNISILPK